MGRAPCCDKANVKRGPWSPEEDDVLRNYIERQGTGGNWIALPHKAGLKRCGKSCRLRWLNYLRPDIKHGGFTDEEDNIICTLFKNIGSRWSVIASHLPGRTDNDVKNYWNTKLKKKLIASETTPTTYIHHSPSSTIIPTVKLESDVNSEFSMPPGGDAGFGYSTEYPQRTFWELSHFQTLGLLVSPDVNLGVNGYSDGSMASSSTTMENSSNNFSNWFINGSGDDDLFPPELRFDPPTQCVGAQEKMVEVEPYSPSALSNMWATAPETKSQGLCQGMTYS